MNAATSDEHELTQVAVVSRGQTFTYDPILNRKRYEPKPATDQLQPRISQQIQQHDNAGHARIVEISSDPKEMHRTTENDHKIP